MHIDIIDEVNDANPLKSFSEDLIIKANNLCIVLDGATGIGTNYIDQEKSDAFWFVNIFKQKILLYWNSNIKFKDALNLALSDISDIYKKLIKNKKINIYNYPSASMIALVFENNIFKLYSLGDCIAYSRNYNKELISKNNVLDKNEKETINLMQMHIDNNYSYNESRSMIKEHLIKNRQTMNTENGYGILSINNDCLPFLEEKIIEKDDTLILCTDGFSAIVDKYKLKKISDIFSISLSNLIDIIRANEYDDSELKKFPRTKMHDDASAIKVSIK